MPEHAALEAYLAGWAGGDAGRGAVARAVCAFAAAGRDIAGVVARGPLDGDQALEGMKNAGGDAQKPLDIIANDVVRAALERAPVAVMGSEEEDGPVQLARDGPLAVNVDPLDGSSNIDANLSIGTIFSILPSNGQQPLLQPGSRQLAAGFLIYGPQTALALTLGEGAQIFWLDPADGAFRLARPNVAVPPETREYAINTSNFRHWDPRLRRYIEDCRAGAAGPRKSDFNMRWTGSLVADAFRILTRGGVYIYPADARKGYEAGRLRLLYEANPIAFLMEQAGGACSTGETRMLDVKPTGLHQRIPLIFGSRDEVREVSHYLTHEDTIGERSPLFAYRGLFRQ